MLSRSKMILLLCLFLLTLPTAAQETNLTRGCVENYDAAADYFPDKIETEYSTGFEVTYHGSYKVVTLKTPWPGAAAADSVTYLLVQCGTPTPEGFDDAVQVSVPVNNFAALSTTYLPYVEIYDLYDQLIGVDTLSTVSTAGILEKGAAGELVELAPNYELNLEVAVDLGAEIIMTYGFGFETDNYLQLEAAGLTTVLNGEFAETSPLARAEWGKFLALFFNKEAAAEAAFDAVVAEYTALAARVAQLEDRPTVFLNTPFEGTWYMAGGQSYMAQFLRDAGADYLWADDEGSATLFLDFEAVFDKAVDAEYWVNVNQFWFMPDDILQEDARFAEFAAYQNGRVYSNNLALTENFGNDFYETGVAYPNRILADLVAIFHPDLLPDHAFYYYRRLATGE